MDTIDTFKELLNAYWLRPETAVWRELDIRAMKSFEFRSPSLDLGCGDGIFNFLRAGGGFDTDFDAFQNVHDLDRFFQNVDVFDAYDKNFVPNITRVPKYMIDWGLDHKANLLNKARGLGFYSNLTLADGNKPLPFENDSFNSVFSNIIYWLDDPEAAIAEIRRILGHGGRACLMLPNISLPKFRFYNNLYLDSHDDHWKFLEKLDRGRSKDDRQARSADDWEHIFQSVGLRVDQHVQHLSKTTIQMWDIGLRPLFPVLKKMSALISEREIRAIKLEWIATLRQFLDPIVAMDHLLGQGQQPAFHCYVLVKE